MKAASIAYNKLSVARKARYVKHGRRICVRPKGPVRLLGRSSYGDAQRASVVKRNLSAARYLDMHPIELTQAVARMAAKGATTSDVLKFARAVSRASGTRRAKKHSDSLLALQRYQETFGTHNVALRTTELPFLSATVTVVPSVHAYACDVDLFASDHPREVVFFQIVPKHLATSCLDLGSMTSLTSCMQPLILILCHTMSTTLDLPNHMKWTGIASVQHWVLKIPVRSCITR